MPVAPKYYIKKGSMGSQVNNTLLVRGFPDTRNRNLRSFVDGK
jgi:hypothetical protein